MQRQHTQPKQMLKQVNVQADWNDSDTNSNAFIKNKPTIPTNNNQLSNGFILGMSRICG